MSDPRLTAAQVHEAMNEPPQNFYVETPWTWRDRLRCRWFPQSPCPTPDPVGTDGDVLFVRTNVGLSWPDRLRVLVTGKLAVEARVAVGVKLGEQHSASVANVVTKF